MTPCTSIHFLLTQHSNSHTHIYIPGDLGNQTNVYLLSKIISYLALFRALYIEPIIPSDGIYFGSGESPSQPALPSELQRENDSCSTLLVRTLLAVKGKGVATGTNLERAVELLLLLLQVRTLVFQLAVSPQEPPLFLLPH